MACRHRSDQANSTGSAVDNGLAPAKRLLGAEGCSHRCGGGLAGPTLTTHKALKHQLWFQFFATLVLALLLFAVLSGLLWRLGAKLDDDERQAQQPVWQLAIVERLMLQMGADPATLQQNLVALADGTVARVSVFDLQGRRLASVGEPLAWVARDVRDLVSLCPQTTFMDGVVLPAGACDALRGHTWRRNRSGLMTVLHLADGRTVVAQWPWQGFSAWWRAPWVPLLLPVLLAVAVALATWPLARRLTRRLEALQRQVEALGQGDLAARVDVRGRDEVADLAQSFNRSAERIETLVAAHRHLLAHASHELRSPLARLKVAVDIIERDAVTASPHQIAEVHRNVQELDVLIDEILTASRLEAVGSLPAQQLEPVDVLGLVVEEAAHFGLGADDGDESADVVQVQVNAGRGSAVPERSVGESSAVGLGDSPAYPPRLRLHVLPAGCAPPMIDADSKLMRRLIRNLLENARRYGKAPTEVVVLTEPAAGRGQAARLVMLAVGDHGTGVAAADQSRLFEPFFRAQGHAESEGGTGLGLALVRQIARLHAAEVSYQSGPLKELQSAQTLPDAAAASSWFVIRWT